MKDETIGNKMSSYKYLCPWCHNEVPMPLSSPVFGEEDKCSDTATCKHCNITLPIFVWNKLFELDNYKEEHQPEVAKLKEIHEKQYEERLVTDWEQTFGIEHKHEHNPAYATCPFCGCRIEARNMDFWQGVECKCGAMIKECGQETIATKEK